ncbi:MAG: LLM class flavin-dependent oxidoreductase, partial [Syntrophobacterales bacterium]
SEYQIVKEQLDLMRAAEDYGFDSIWPAEHHFSEYGDCSSPSMSLAAIASVTKRIRLGTGIVVLPFHNPIRVAEDFALLDLMSDGRVTPCRSFIDYTVGNVKEATLTELWNSPAYVTFRQSLRQDGLMPVCSRCCGLMGF